MDKQDHQLSSNEQLQALTEENQQLRENERLFTKVGYLECRLGYLASSNTDLSCRLIQSEEDKLKISKELVDEKMQTNKMREQFEEEKFELKNKLLNQASAITELEMERDNLSRALQSAEACLKVGEKSGQDLTEEYTALKNSYLALADAHDKEQNQGEKLSAELLALAQAQDALRLQLEEQQQSVETSTRGLHCELDRVRALISSMSHNRVKVRHYLETKMRSKKCWKMKNSYEEQQKKLEQKVVEMGKEHQEDKRAIRNRQQELSERSAALMCSQSQVKEAEDENSKLHLQVKKLNEKYRSRLVWYLQDLSEYIDGLGEGKSPPEASKLRAHVDSMLQDVRSSYRAREEQLASAARSYKKRLQEITKTHHGLLIAYRVQREQILAQPQSGLDPGPPEAPFSLEPSELREETERELQQRRQDEARLEAQLQVVALKMPVQNLSRHEKQLREISDSTLVSLEKDQALLITRVTVAEAQVSELQDYIDNHLGRSGSHSVCNFFKCSLLEDHYSELYHCLQSMLWAQILFCEQHSGKEVG
ncbi:Coiled-coil domain containing protein 78 [Dissostichus eleginoides]|uniref:Coiled-coil domain containing protein 78 n=1 Tax=Dissostichus eleginoides TaxID=100907 RepID=A0AAD9BGR0_DISEL|nr:Coiled-coil domain containing protein 78 [Dissostichus eleginoides]